MRQCDGLLLGVSETVVAAVFLLHERSVDEIVSKAVPREARITCRQTKA